MKMTHAINHSGEGKITVAQFAALARAIENEAPDNATVIFHASEDPRDHDWSWRVNVTWETEVTPT